MLSTHPTLLHRHGCCEILTLKHIKQGNWWNKTHTPNFFCSVKSSSPAQSTRKINTRIENPPQNPPFFVLLQYTSWFTPKGHVLIQPYHFHWPSQYYSLWTMIYVSALDAHYIVVKKHSQPDELDHSSHHSPSTTALYILLAPKKKRNKATINLNGPHLTALY